MTPTPKKKRNKNPVIYFTQVHEDAILEYCSSTDKKFKNKIYEEVIAPVLDELVDKIVFTYKFTHLSNIDVLRDECKNWLVTVLSLYKPEKGSKAFTYLSVVTKNWFIAEVKKSTKKIKQEILIDEFYLSPSNTHQDKNKNDDDIHRQLNEELVVYNTYEEDRSRDEFFRDFKQQIKDWGTLRLTPNEKKILSAIEILFENTQDIEIYNKKAIYLYIREITGLNTKQVVSSLNKIRKRYKDFKVQWEKK